VEFRLSCRNEIYYLVCWHRAREVELPASARRHSCPHCGASLVVDLRASQPQERQSCHARTRSPLHELKSR
jgi:hypothetical protein